MAFRMKKEAAMFDIKLEGRLTLAHLLLPISMITFTVMLLFAFQATQIMRDRNALQESKMQQQKAFEDSQRLQSQLNALLIGTKNLAQQGNPSAKVISDRLRQVGVFLDSPSPAAAPKTLAPVPAAAEIPKPGPIKP